MAAQKPWVGKTAVIIDDSATVREEMKRVFEACGLQVAGVAENGVTGLDLIEAKRPDIVCLDIIMPEMDGLECYRKLMAHAPETKVVIVSWLAGESKIIENLKDVIPAYVFQAKPVSAQDLEARLLRVYFPERERDA